MTEINKNNGDVLCLNNHDGVKFQNLDLYVIGRIIWKRRMFVGLFVVIAIVLGALFSFTLPNVYKSEATLISNAHEQSSNSLKSLAGSLSGFASLAGVDLGGGGTDKTAYALEILKSREFIYKFIDKYDLKPSIFAASGWNDTDNKLLFDEALFDTKKNSWLSDAHSNSYKEPSIHEVYEHFLKHNFSVTKNEKTGVVKLSITHFSPKVAKFIVDRLVVDLNTTIKIQDMVDAENSIKYLTKELNETTFSGLKSTFYTLIEQQHQTLMLTKVREQYAFKVIDKAVVPYKKSGPKRGLIIIGFTILGIALSIIITLIRERVS